MTIWKPGFNLLYKNWEILPLTKSVSNYYHELICTFLERICLFYWKTKTKKKILGDSKEFKKIASNEGKPLEIIFKLKFFTHETSL